MSYRPKVTDIEVDFDRRGISIVRIQEALSEFQEIPQLKGDLDVGTRKEALILGVTGGQLIVFADGHVGTRFRDMQLEDVEDLVAAVLKKVADIHGWNLSDEPVTLETDLVYAEPSTEDATKYLMEVVDSTKLERLGVDSQTDVHAVGLRLFFTPFADKKHDIRILIEPSAIEPTAKFYLRASYRQREARVSGLAEHLKELTNKVGGVLSALPVGS